MTIQHYIESVSKRLQSGISREHSYRGDLEALIRALVNDVDITNEPANVTNCGNPDYVITKGKIPIGYIEAKDIDKDLNSKSYKEQFDRYKKALDNLIITDYVWFQFFQEGVLVHEIRIAEIEDNVVKPLPENYSKFENLIKDFCSHIGQTIKSSKKLAEMMAGKARLLQVILERAITSDEETQENTSLKGQYDTFKQILIHDLKPKGFADIYAQTLAYGMFAARLHDPTLDDFSRQEAAELIPKSNPFLRKLFGYVAGPDIDERIVTVVDNLAEVFRATNVEQLLKNFGKSTQTNDPIIHFYETFLAEYDAKLRKARGVWYTPEPVVNFIVRAVDDILKTEFNLPQGIADTSKTKIKIKTDIANKNFKSGYKEVEKEVHKVQILDPATGTGTFLAEVVKFIYNKNFKTMQGAWSGYVEEHLIPRLNGFELLMASYAMAHLKLDMLLTETGYKSTKNERLNVYLTNSLEAETGTVPNLFMAQWLTEEALLADIIKRDRPVMCVIGNPPYAVSSTNKGKWIEKLTADYKKDLNERNIQPLSDDYIKFIRYGQHYIEKNGEGILAYISNNSFIDGIIHRQMRKHLLETFDKIYILDLHGNSRKKEVCPDGSPDQNVFDIMQGVSINIFVKTGQKKKNSLGKIFHSEVFGKRDVKYSFLFDNTVSTIKWQCLKNKEPYFFFVPKDFELTTKYNLAIDLRELFTINSVGIVTGKDAVLVKEDKDSFEEEFFEKISIFHYRPFDYKYTIFDNSVLQRSRFRVMQHYFKRENLGLNIPRQSKLKGSEALIDKNITCKHLITGETYNFPLYLYPDEKDGIFTDQKRKPNLNQDIVNQIAEKIGLTFVPDHEPCHSEQSEESQKQIAILRQSSVQAQQTPRNDNNTFTPLDILDYIYAILHSPTYREKYKEFLKIDFPRVPYPKDKKTFWSLVKLGKEVREIHLLESKKIEDYITSYPKDGDNIITRKMSKTSLGFEANIITSEKTTCHSERSEESQKEIAILRQSSVQAQQTPRNDIQGKVWINDTQYFDNIPLVAWEFYIGGYQPAQKWLKDRKGRALKFEDILHYQKIIVALFETDRIMKAIDKIEIE